MPDGELPEDYSEPMLAVSDTVHFAGAERTLVRESHRFSGFADSMIHVSQEFECGSKRELIRMPDDRCIVVSVQAVNTDRVQRQHFAELQDRLDSLSAAIGSGSIQIAELSRSLAPLTACDLGFSTDIPSTAIHGPIQPPPTVHESPDWIVYRADQPIIAASLGYGTSWCTAYPSRMPIWEDYAEGDLYVVHGRGNRRRRRTKYQIHMDDRGRIECERHDGEDMHIGEIALRHPDLAPWLAELHAKSRVRRKG